MTQSKQRDFTEDQRICDAATAGPWESVDGGNYEVLVITRDPAHIHAPVIAESIEVTFDARFIAEARTGWPAALAEIARLREVMDRASDMLPHYSAAYRLLQSTLMEALGDGAKWTE